MNEISWLAVCFSALVSGGIGALIGDKRGRVGAGVFWSIFLGPIGWLIVLLGPDERPKCTECGGVIAERARRCRHCGFDFMAAKKKARTVWNNDPWGEAQREAPPRPIQAARPIGARQITIKRRA